MALVIREDIPAHMADLRAWLDETRGTPLEEMRDFFTARIDGYEEHMSPWAKAYEVAAEMLPEDCAPLLDLGCGTGLELDAVFCRFPALPVTGIDCCETMLSKLREKHAARALTLRCEDYLTADLGGELYGAALSVESLHHFTPAQKALLYRAIFRALRPGGVFLNVDYLACCDEEETVLRAECDRRRAAQGIAPGQFVHFDTPLTVPHERAILHQAGFTRIDTPACIAGATFVLAKK